MKPLNLDDIANIAIESPVPFVRFMRELERKVIVRALQKSEGSRTNAAKHLQLGRTTLVEKMRKHGLLERK